ncbi:lonely Cys domain-containing protein, partial [Streptomyces hebeiensis]|uniref:lonely Cys domain-containing protein n=1 Tax=Streptomyces hebeiensis TaxID=229486 RepID=UPI0031DE91AE
MWLGKRDAARYIAGLPEVRELPPGHRPHLEVCWGASDGDPYQQLLSHNPSPHVDDPLDDVPLGQYFSNESREETSSVTRPTGVDNHGRVVIDAPGEAGRVVNHRPEPLDHELDQLARDAGLHQGPGAVSAETRATMLRLVRALRSVFGNEIEDHRGPGGRYERVFNGIVALERMRANDTSISGFTPLRLDMLAFFVQGHTGRVPDLAGYVALLDFAAARVAADPGAKLTEAVPAPAVQITLNQLADNGERITRYVQSLSATAAFTPRHMASTLWAMTRVAQTFRSMTPAEREAMGRQVLHLGAAAVWDRSQQEALWVLMAKATAEGMDASDRDLLAAYHLRESGAFGPAALLRHGPNVQGVNWSGTAAPAGINWTQVTYGSDGTPAQPDWVGPGKAMPLLNVVHVDRAGNIVLHLPGRAPLPVSENEFLALLTLDPAYRATPIGNPVLFLTTGDGALSPELVQRFSQNTGRPAFAYSAPMTLTSAAPSVSLGIVALPDPDTNAPGRWTAATRQSTVPGASDTDDGLIVFAPTPASSAQLPDVGGLRIGEAVGSSTGSSSGSSWSAETLMTSPSGAPRGRNLTGEKVRHLRLGRVRVFEELSGSPLREVSGADADAPWGDAAYAVWGENDPSGVRFPDGRVLNAEELAAELAGDPELAKLPKDMPVVLVVPYLANERNLEFLRAVANLLDRPVWAASGDGRLVRNKKREHVPALIDHGPEHPLGAWVPFRPTKLSVPRVDREWTALDGTTFRDSDVDSRPLVSDRHERFGQMSHADGVRDREQKMRSYLHAKKLVHLMPSGGRTALVSEEVRTPDPAVYTYVAHGLPGGLQLALKDGRTVWLGAADGGRYIGGLPEVAELPEGYRLGLEVCFSDAAGNPLVPQLDNRPAPAVHDPLDEVSLAQHAANESRLETDGSLMSSGFDVDTHILIDTPGGVAGRRRRAVPEPLPHELDAMARTAGLHTSESAVSPETRATMLRLVRALRIVFGPEVEKDPGLYEQLRKGIGAMETMRANDPALGRFTPFRMELWTFMAQRVGGRKIPSPEDYRQVLDISAQVLALKPGARLGEDMPDLFIQHALKQVTQMGAGLVRSVLRQPGADTPVTKKAVTWAFWAVAGAARQMGGMDAAFTEKLGRRVLHMFPDEQWTPARKQELWVLTAQAIAAGLDPSDYFTLAAFHLASKGAFGPAHLLQEAGNARGYNWSGTPAPDGVDLRAVGTQDQAGDTASRKHFSAPWAAEGEPGEAMVVWTDTDADGFPVLHLPGMRPFRVADRELLALLDLAPLLRVMPLGVPLVFVASGPGGDKGRSMVLSEAFSNRTARNGWAYSGPLTMAPATTPSPRASSGPLRLVGLPEAGTGQPGAWRKAWLQGLNSSVLFTAPYGDAVFSSPTPVIPRTLTAPEDSGPLVLSRDELTRRVHLVAGRGPVRGLSVERCLVLLRGLRDELYPNGVRPATTVDDSVIDQSSAASSLVMGPGWRGVRSWAAVAGAVAAAGPGAAALILAQRQGETPGHAWAAYNLGGTDGVVWVDVSAGAEGRVSEVPPEVAASDAQAVVIDPAGQAIDP